MKTSNALLVGLGVVSSMVSSMTLAQSTSNRDADMQHATPDARTLPASPVTGETGAQSLGTPSPSQSGTPAATGQPGQSRLGNQTATEPAASAPGEQSSGASSVANRPAPAPMTKVEPQTVNGVTYLCGGVGTEEAQFMKRSAREYDMMLTFATKRGEYLSDVNVDIKDANGRQLLQTRCGGPMMLVDFPQGGTYRVHAETGGYSLSRTAHVSEKRGRTAMVVMHWPQQIVEESPVSTGSTGSTGSSGNGNGDSGGPADPNSSSNQNDQSDQNR